MQVLVYRHFNVDSVYDVQDKFKSLIDAGWSVSADVTQPQPRFTGSIADAVLNSHCVTLRPQPKEEPQHTKTATELIVDAIVGKHKISLTKVGSLVGVSQGSLSNYLRGRSRTPSLVLRRLRKLASQEGPARPIKPRRRWTVTKLTDEQCLEIAVRNSCGESTITLAKEFGIPRERVSRIRAKLED